MVAAVLPQARRQAGTRIPGRHTLAVGIAFLLLLGGGWLWAEWGSLIAFDNLVSFCF